MNNAVTQLLSTFLARSGKPVRRMVLRVVCAYKEIGHEDGFMIPSEERFTVIDCIRFQFYSPGAVQIIFKDGKLFYIGDDPSVFTNKELISSLRKHIFPKNNESIIFTDPGKVVYREFI